MTPQQPQEDSQPALELADAGQSLENTPAEVNVASAEDKLNASAAEPAEDALEPTADESPKFPDSGQHSPNSDSGHDDSDFEDNITVTVPPAHMQGGNIFRDRHMNGRHGRHHRLNAGTDTPPPKQNSVNVGFFFFDCFVFSGDCLIDVPRSSSTTSIRAPMIPNRFNIRKAIE